MAERPLDIEILRKGRPEAKYQLHADPDDTREMQKALRRWLTGARWAEPLWPQFELVARLPRHADVLARVKA